MGSLLIRDLEPALKRAIAQRAAAEGRSLSEEAKKLPRERRNVPEPPKKLGTWMASLLPDEFRGDDPVFEIKGEISKPPEFE
ncbi:MAG: hypothetical protein K8H87_02235 [Pseudorhodoplanes sp.]|nr:hypothetical protein [Pseudorhodoplanes sp.]